MLKLITLITYCLAGLENLRLHYKISTDLLQVITTGFYTLFVIILGLFTTKKRFELIHYISIVISITGGTFIIISRDLEGCENRGNYLVPFIYIIIYIHTLSYRH